MFAEKLNKLNLIQIDRIVEMAWEDRTLLRPLNTSLI